ncbi:DDE-type integrase/transposase/recombinase, partial [Streptomyces griseomycini]|uniref:DDE-type integrase/transposase/recombinase n=1 Tax=Streptomyces griseomycini TaxID=66895 RepID=UPI0036F215D3
MRGFRPDPTATDARWCGDITYIPTDEGWLYLATVIDVASRRVVGWATADHLSTELVAEALRAACRRRRPPPWANWTCTDGLGGWPPAPANATS